MPVIKIKVRDKCAEGEGVIICNNSDYTVVWDLDEEWEPYSARTMRVNLADGTYQDVVFTGDNADLPVLTASGWVSVGLYAGDLHTSRAARLLALSSVLTPGGSPAAPAEDVYAQIMAKLNELSTVSPEDIAKAVADYLAAHPIEETDPTVPEWAKAKTKPTYSAAEVGAIAQSDLQAATDAALAQAKASGEFDGPRGPAGAPGKDGTAGADGVTPTIGDNGNWYIGSTDTGKPSRGNTGPAGTPGKDGAGMDLTGATVGQIAKIAAVDENGQPTEWEAVDFSSGGDAEKMVRHIATVSVTAGTTSYNVTVDSNGDPLNLESVYILTNNFWGNTGSYVQFSINGRELTRAYGVSGSPQAFALEKMGELQKFTNIPKPSNVGISFGDYYNGKSAVTSVGFWSAGSTLDTTIEIYGVDA